MNSNNKYKTLILIVGICLISAVVIGFRLYRKGTIQKTTTQNDKNRGALLLVSDLPNISSTTTGRIEDLLEAAFADRRLVMSSTYQIARTENKLVFAAPSYSKEAEAIGGCGLSDNPYCGLYLVTPTSSRLIAFGSKLAGFEKVERFIDPQHAQFLTAWSLFNFTSIDRKQLNLETGEIIPMLIVEIDQDSQSASLNAIGNGRIATLMIEGSTERSRLIPERITIQDSNHRMLFALAEEDILELQHRVSADVDQRIMSIVLQPTDEDVIEEKLQVKLYGVPYIFDLVKNSLEKIK